MTIVQGDRYGLLTVKKVIKSKHRGNKVRCECACGNRAFYCKRGQLERGEVTKCDRC